MQAMWHTLRNDSTGLWLTFANIHMLACILPCAHEQLNKEV